MEPTEQIGDERVGDESTPIGPSSEPNAGPRRRSRILQAKRRRRRVIGWSFAAVGALLIAAVAWIGVRGWLAYGELIAVRGEASGVGASLLADPEGAAATIEALGQRTERAASLTSDPVWRAAELLPWAGPNLEAVRVTAASLDTVVREVALPLAGEVGGLEASLAPVDGRIDTAPLVELRGVTGEAAARITVVEQQLAGIDAAALVGPLADAVDEFEGLVDPIASGVHAVHGATELMPALLGADGPRDTLLLFLNNAEVRSTVGIPGALALVHADDGVISLAQQASTSDFPAREQPIMQLSPELQGIYGDRPALWMQNVTMAPEFATSGELASLMWQQQFGIAPQAVIALDPFTLSYLLEATGPIELSTGDTLTSDNTVNLLLHEVYLRYEDPAMQDAMFADASAQVFDRIASGQFDTRMLLAALARGVDENRVKLWSSVPEEQAVIAGTALAGALPSGDERDTVFALTLNDGTGAKMDVFLATETEVAVQACPIDGAPASVTLRVTLESRAPADTANLPKYITGGGMYYGLAPGQISTVARLYAPPGMELRRVQTLGADGQWLPEGVTSALSGDHSLAIWQPILNPGESHTVELTYQTAQPRIHEVVIRQTPTFHDSVTQLRVGKC